MRGKILWVLIKKEITDVLRDKKTLMAMIGIPLLLYPLIMIGVTMLAQLVSSQTESDTTTILLQGEVPEDFNEFLVWYDLENVDFLSVVEEGENEYTLNFTEDGAEIDYDSTIEIQGFTTWDFRDLFSSYKVYQLEKALVDNLVVADIIDTDNIVFNDTATNTQSVGQLLGSILPILLLVGVTLGVIYPTIDIITGEKERGTMETLLSLPVTPLEIVTSKFITITLGGIVSALLNLLSMGISMWYLIYSFAGNEGADIFTTLDFSQLLMPIFVTGICLVTFTFLVSALSMIVVSLAKTFKEAQNYLSPLMIVIMAPAYLTSIPNLKLDTVTSFIPVLNISLLIKEAFNFNIDLSTLALVVLSNIVYSALAIVILGKVFSNENILFGDIKNFRLLEGRKNLAYGGTPGASDAVVLFSVSIVVLLYGSGFLAQNIASTELTLFIVQLFILICPLAYAYYIKCDFKETFSLNKFSPKYLAIGIPMIYIGLFAVLQIQEVLMNAVPSLREFAESFSGAISFDNLLLSSFVIAVMPGICEEIFFRGFMLKAFKVDKHPATAIFVTALLFGIYHMNVLQLITGLALGSVLGYITYKSKSIYPAIILHFLNNFTVVLISYYQG